MVRKALLLYTFNYGYLFCQGLVKSSKNDEISYFTLPLRNFSCHLFFAVDGAGAAAAAGVPDEAAEPDITPEGL